MGTSNLSRELNHEPFVFLPKEEPMLPNNTTRGRKIATQDGLNKKGWGENEVLQGNASQGTQQH